MCSSGVNIPYSCVDVKSNVTLPELNNELLAYETGVHIGDGSLQVMTGGTHSIRYFGHSEDDWAFYSEKIPSIILQLYNKKVVPTRRTDAMTCTLSLCSKAVAIFKRDILGLPVGSKEKLQGLPSFIMADEELLINCLRGIADSDFSLFFYKKNGSYSHPAISCTMSNKRVVQDIETGLRQLGFNPCVRYDVVRNRNSKLHLEHVLTVCGKDNLRRWIDIIDFWNPKHKTKFVVWDRLGYCLPKQSTNKRLALIASFFTQYEDPVELNRSLLLKRG